jgi:hypothetical protein
LDPSVQNCVDCYTSDWVVVKRRYQNHSSSVRTREDLELGQEENLPRQEFEFDDSPEASPELDNLVSDSFSIPKHCRIMLATDRCAQGGGKGGKQT